MGNKSPLTFNSETNVFERTISNVVTPKILKDKQLD